MLTTEDVVEQKEQEAGTTTAVLEQDTEPLVDSNVDTFQIELIAMDDIYVSGGRQSESLVSALVDSISHIGLQNPICVVKNDIAGHPAPYRIVSGRKRLEAFVKLKRETIPCHVLTFVPEDPHTNLRKQLAEYEENLVRDQLSLVELCAYLGKSKAVYEALYPETKHGGAEKKPGKDPGTRSLPYVLNGARMLGKSRATIGKLLQIYSELIAPKRLEALQAFEHPMLHRVEDLSALAKSKDAIPALVEILCKDSDKTGGKFCSLQDAQQKLTRKKEEALRKAQEATQNQHAQRANTTRSQESDTTESPTETTVNGTAASNKRGSDSGNSRSDIDDSDEHVEEGLALDDVINGCIVSLQEQMDEYLRTFSVQISQEHNAVHFVFSSTLSQPEGVTDLPALCPGWGLHNASAEICGTCVHKTRCEKAQTRIVCED